MHCVCMQLSVSRTCNHLSQDDDERTLEEDDALITEEERRDEVAALQNEMDLPLEELIKRYSSKNCMFYL